MDTAEHRKSPYSLNRGFIFCLVSGFNSKAVAQSHIVTVVVVGIIDSRCLYWLPSRFSYSPSTLSSLYIIYSSPLTATITVDTMDERALLLLLLVAKLPLMARVALLHVLRLSPPSRYIDLRTELSVAVLRSFMEPAKPMSITATQKLLNRDPGIKGRIWVAKYTGPMPPEPSSRDALIRAIESMRSPVPSSSSTSSSLKDLEWTEANPVEAEWTGYRASATSSSTLPDVSEADKYAELMKEVRSPVTVLYLHGGAYFLMDPATHRPTTKKIAKLTGGRCYSVRYRLAPQAPFPAALLDALHSYLTLLYPPEGAFHQAVQPQHVVLAGDRYVTEL